MKNLTEFIIEAANKVFKFAKTKSIGEESQKRKNNSQTKEYRKEIADEYGYENPTDVCCGYCKYYSYNLGTGGDSDKGTCRNPNRQMENKKVFVNNWCGNYDFPDYTNCPRVYFGQGKYKWTAPDDYKEVLKNSKL